MISSCRMLKGYLESIAKNRLQAYTVSKKAGHLTSAESWVTVVPSPVFPVSAVEVLTVRVKPLSVTCTVPWWSDVCAHEDLASMACQSESESAPLYYCLCRLLRRHSAPRLVFALGLRIKEIEEVPLFVDNAVESCKRRPLLFSSPSVHIATS